MVYHLSVFIFVIIFLSLGTEIETPVSDLAGWAKMFHLYYSVIFSNPSPSLGQDFGKKARAYEKKYYFSSLFFVGIFKQGAGANHHS